MKHLSYILRKLADIIDPPHVPDNIVLFELSSESAVLPIRKYSGDAGYDLYTNTPTVIPAGAFVDITTGVYIKMPPNTWCRITGRSSTIRTWKLQVQEGIIDNGYTGEMFIGVWNTTSETVEVPAGTRLAQIIFHPLLQVEWEQGKVMGLSTGRGNNGFGSTGV